MKESASGELLIRSQANYFKGNMSAKKEKENIKVLTKAISATDTEIY